MLEFLKTQKRVKQVIEFIIRHHHKNGTIHRPRELRRSLAKNPSTEQETYPKNFKINGLPDSQSSSEQPTDPLRKIYLSRKVSASPSRNNTIKMFRQKRDGPWTSCPFVECCPKSTPRQLGHTWVGELCAEYAKPLLHLRGSL